MSVLQNANIVSKTIKQPRKKTLEWRRSVQVSEDKPHVSYINFSVVSWLEGVYNAGSFRILRAFWVPF